MSHLVSLSTMEGRIRRALKRTHQRLCSPRSPRLGDDLGLHIVDSNNCIVATHCSVAELAEEMELLCPGEELEAAHG